MTKFLKLAQKLKRCMFCLLYRELFLTGPSAIKSLTWVFSNGWSSSTILMLQSCFAVRMLRMRISVDSENQRNVCWKRGEKNNNNKKKALWIMTSVLKSRHKAAEEIWAFRNHLICLSWCRFPARRAWTRSGVFWGAKQDVNMEI